MNEYTRREEIRWTLATVFVLVPAIAIGIVRLALAVGPMVTNPVAIAAESAAQQAASDYKACNRSARELDTNVSVFIKRAEQAKKAASTPRPPGAPAVKPGRVPWSPSAAQVLKHATALHQGGCRHATESAVGPRAASAGAWKAIAAAPRIKKPGNSVKAQASAASQLLALFKSAPVAELKKQAGAADEKLGQRAATATKQRESDFIRAPLAQGLFPLNAAIGVGVGVALAALLISYVSVRSASVRRGRTLMALRRFANTPEAGLQAAAIVRLAAHHNGGEPGMVVGAALGGLAAALFAPTDSANIFVADLYVAGAMGGLLVGLAGQWLVRNFTGVSSWRERTKELGDVEKPSIPVALILGGVTPGLERQFLRYFEALPVADAATVVQKLAAQAEEQILAAADAAANHSHYPGAHASYQGGGPQPPGL